MSVFAHAEFITSVAQLRQLPPPGAPEIAFAGRSNAGKSSAINTLAGERRLAHVSKTPGRTQLINFFQLRGGSFLVDLPGYGYAAVPEAVQRNWRELLEGYLTLRESLFGLVLVMDARRPLLELDWQMLDWFRPTGRPVHLLLTKSDKLTRSEAAQAISGVRRSLEGRPEVSAQLFSSLKRSGLDEAEAMLAGWLGLDAVAGAEKKGPR